MLATAANQQKIQLETRKNRELKNRRISKHISPESAPASAVLGKSVLGLETFAFLNIPKIIPPVLKDSSLKIAEYFLPSSNFEIWC